MEHVGLLIFDGFWWHTKNTMLKYAGVETVSHGFKSLLCHFDSFTLNKMLSFSEPNIFSAYASSDQNH